MRAVKRHKLPLHEVLHALEIKPDKMEAIEIIPFVNLKQLNDLLTTSLPVPQRDMLEYQDDEDCQVTLATKLHTHASCCLKKGRVRVVL